MAVLAFDVWLHAANTVYKGVPFGAVTDWAQQGRLAADDKVRPAGTNEPWVRAADHDIIGDYLFVKSTTAPPAIPLKAHEALEPVEMDVGWRKSREDDDDDVDMIPLIDISLVLLIFFMMTAAVSALSPVAVPEMKNIADLKTGGDAFTVTIDKNPLGEVIYSVRIGDRAPEKIDADLPTLASALVRLDAKLAEVLAAGNAPPEVRIACHKELPSERVHELSKELQRRKDDKKISLFGAEVNEKNT